MLFIKKDKLLKIMSDIGSDNDLINLDYLNEIFKVYADEYYLNDMKDWEFTKKGEDYE